MVDGDWLSLTEAVNSPYYPQRHDEVVLFRQGYDHFLRELSTTFPSLHRKFTKLPNTFGPVSFFRVENVRFELGPPTYCTLTLRQIPDETELTINYIDVNGISDFIILKDRYEASKLNNFMVRQQVVALFAQGQKYTGEVVAVSKDQSPWEKYEVAWFVLHYLLLLLPPPFKYYFIFFWLGRMETVQKLAPGNSNPRKAVTRHGNQRPDPRPPYPLSAKMVGAFSDSKKFAPVFEDCVGFYLQR